MSDPSNFARRLDYLPEPLRGRLQYLRNLGGALFRDITEGGLDFYATSLVYSILLSLAPLLAVSFSVLKAFGAHNQLRPFLMRMVEPLGEQGGELVERIIGFVDNLDVGVLGTTGFALLFYTVVSLLQKIENAFNRIWRVRTQRSLHRRFSDYLSVLMVGPVLVFSAFGVMASMASHTLVKTLIAYEPLGTLYYGLGRLLPVLFMAGAYTFLYSFIPNTSVRLKAATAGGITAAMAWWVVGKLFRIFVAGSAQYAAVYSGFAILIVFMIWLYANSLILLVGVEIAFYVQNPHYMDAGRQPARIGSALFRRSGLLLMVLLARRFLRGEPPWTLAGLAARLHLPDESITAILEALSRNGLVVDAGEGRYLPARETGTLPVKDILAALETDARDGPSPKGLPENDPAVDRVLVSLEEARGKAVGDLSLKSLAEESPAEKGPAVPAADPPGGTNA